MWFSRGIYLYSYFAIFRIKVFTFSMLGRMMLKISENDRGLRELADSMEEHSLLQPVRVRPDADGNYTLVSGYRRLCAARQYAEVAALMGCGAGVMSELTRRQE
jgi:hypothetical protein